MSDEEARAAAQEILAQHSFARWDSDFEPWLRALESLLDLIPAGLIDFLRWLQELLIEKILANVLGALAHVLSLFGVFGDSAENVGWLAALLLIATAIVVAYRVLGSRFRGSRNEEPDGHLKRTHSESMAEARAIAGEGRYLEATHRVQLATLALLIDSGWLELARSDPNRTLRQRVADSSLPGQERTRLIGLVDRLEALWFDEPREDRGLFEEWLALDDRLLRVVGGMTE